MSVTAHEEKQHNVVSLYSEMLFFSLASKPTHCLAFQAHSSHHLGFSLDRSQSLFYFVPQDSHSQAGFSGNWSHQDGPCQPTPAVRPAGGNAINADIPHGWRALPLYLCPTGCFHFHAALIWEAPLKQLMHNLALLLAGGMSSLPVSL